MACNCNCNCTPVQTIKIASITTTDTGVILVPSTTIVETDLTNLFRYILIIPCTLTTETVLPIYVQTALGNIPVLSSKSANPIISNQIRKMTNYSLIYGNQNSEYANGQFVLRNNCCG